MNLESLTPIGSNVLLRRLPPTSRFGNVTVTMSDEMSDGKLLPAAGFVGGLSILLPAEVLSYDSFECEVVKLGPGEILKNGSREPMNVKAGDRVVVHQNIGFPVTTDHFLVDITCLEAVVHE